MFIDGDFPTGKECEFHCSPTCHPAQTGPEWQYGCLLPPVMYDRVWCPMVDCDGDPERCEFAVARALYVAGEGLDRLALDTGGN